MNRQFIILQALLLLSYISYSQMYILNEDFSGTSGTEPPNGWSNVMISGGASDEWHFDNPGQRILNYPVTEPFAIFDSETVSANGQAEEVALETALFDASVSNFILLHLHHTFDPGTGGIASILAHDGSDWQQVAVFSSATANPSAEVVDLTEAIGGSTSARLRFLWSGNGSGFWGIDNIRVYASQPLDGGVVSIDSPTSPVTPGIQNVGVTLGNFGYTTITTTTIEWMADGVPQPPFTWNGALGFGQTLSNISIGTYNFQVPVELKVWQHHPNGGSDPNPLNDTVTEYLELPLCGTYTIGGADPDFESFSRVARTLNIAGITCPVTFIVRDGTYYDQFILGDIPGTSAMNTVTFRSESGDSTKAVLHIAEGALKYEPMIYLDGTHHVYFEDLGFITGSSVSFNNPAVEMANAHDIGFERCYVELRKQNDYGFYVHSGTRDVTIIGNRIESISPRASAIFISDDETGNIDIQGNSIKGASEWNYYTVKLETNVSNINLEGNKFEDCYRAVFLQGADHITIRYNQFENSNFGVITDEESSYVEISGNRLLTIKGHLNVQDGTSGIRVESSSEVSIFNNFIHTTGDGLAYGIHLKDATLIQIVFNSVNISSTEDQGRNRGIFLDNSDLVISRNNIFNITSAGFPVSIDGSSSGLDFERNDYYSLSSAIGILDGESYFDLASWSTASGMDASSLSVPPFFSSETDLAINQVLLNDAGLVINGIDVDIDGTPRNPVSPDIGAREYTPCANDAGVNAILSPANPLAGGTEQVKILLQNQGSAALVAVNIHWSVNGQVQGSMPWSGNLAPGGNSEVIIGSYDFQEGMLYHLKSWTSSPNGVSDCNTLNDTISSQDLAAPLCGTYTIGGNNPDFSGFQDAVAVLNLAGVTCPVTLLVRDGIYRENIFLKEIPGSSATNTVTFRSESGDSTKAILQIPADALKFETMIYMKGTQHVSFQMLGMFTGADLGYDNTAVVMEGAKHIRFANCYFEMQRLLDLAFNIIDESQDIMIEDSRIECVHAGAMAMVISGEGTGNVRLLSNYISGSTTYEYNTVRIEKGANGVEISFNSFDNCFRAISLSKATAIQVMNNSISNVNYGLQANDFTTGLIISSNRFSQVRNHPEVDDGTSVIYIQNTSQAQVDNNYIHTEGNGPVKAINLQGSSSCGVYFNSINILNSDPQAKSRGLLVRQSSQVKARNNIFHFSVGGTPVYLEGINSQLDLDRNDYFSFDNAIGYYDNKKYFDITEWTTATGFDLNSISVVPFFTSDTDLSINQVLLNNAGVPIEGITLDIDGGTRDPLTPDIGAKEYSPCGVDAGINAMTAPVSPLPGGTENVEVVLQNQGTVPLTSVKINWSVNGLLQDPFLWSGSLPAASNYTLVIGSYNFLIGKIYTIRIWTSEPNNTQDCNHNNDTITGRPLYSPLCGTYTIGGTEPDFTSMSEAAAVLTAAGVACPVTFLLRDGVYYEQFVIEPIPGSSADNKVIFRSENNDPALVEIRIIPEALKFDPLMNLKGASNITFESLSVFTGSELSDANYAIYLDGSSNIVVRNCYLEMIRDSDIGVVIKGGSQDIQVIDSRFRCVHSKSGAIDVADELTQDIIIGSNHIRGPSLWGSTAVKIGAGVSHVEFTNNETAKFNRAFYAIGVDSINLVNNVIRDVNEGIFLDNHCSDVEINANRLLNVTSHQNLPEGTSGILVRNATRVGVANNFVHTVGIGPCIGISLMQIDSTCSVIYNSLNITNTDAQGKSKGIYLAQIEQFLGRNNIFSINALGIPMDIDQGVQSTSLDYNDYYQPSGLVGRLEGNTYTSLSQWGQTLNGDANSKVVNPFFKADTIPLPYQRQLNGAGISIPEVFYDIDGKLRSTQAPDIGCLEFFVDYGVLDLLSPTLACYHPEVDTVIVHIKQFGDVPFNDLKVAYRMNDGPVHIDTIPGPHYEDVIHNFKTTENLVTYGDYLFKIWLINTLDDNINNDTLYAWRYSKPSPVPSFTYDNFCTGPKVYFFGDATVPAPYFIDSYEWLFGDGAVSTEQNPVHTYQEPGTYDVTCRAYSDAGCYGEITLPVYINPDFIPLTLDYNVTDETCLWDATGSIEIFLEGGYPPVTLTFNGQPADAGLITGLTTGQYIIEAVDAENCRLTDTVNISSVIFMNPQITAGPLTGNSPLTVSFDFAAEGAKSWLWHFTEQDSDTSRSPDFTFMDYGSHMVLLEVMSGPPHYCTETATIEIFVDVIVTIEANNVFTPNGDDVNDYFQIRTTGIKEMEANIFNLWGNKVYKIEELNGRWDGLTTGGAKAPDGTYYWSLEAAGSDNKTYTRQGSVLLLRHAAQAIPNPARERVEVKIFDPLDPPVEVNVYSAFGQLVHTKSFTDGENIVLNLSGLGNGIYFIKVSDGTGNYFVRIIKN